MEIAKNLSKIADSIDGLKSSLQTEEATKMALILPFIKALGYDVFNPMEVCPEYDCDISKSKGEKVDYAIFKDDSPILVIECKHWNQNLSIHNAQLSRYFVSTDARFGLLTNGIQYNFFSDVEKPNIMDSTPFLSFDIRKLNTDEISILSYFTKECFSINHTFNIARKWKYRNIVRELMIQELKEPSKALSKIIASKIDNGCFGSKALSEIRELIKDFGLQLISVFSDSKNKMPCISHEKETHSTSSISVLQEEKIHDEVKIQKHYNNSLRVLSILNELLAENIGNHSLHIRIWKEDFSIVLDDTSWCWMARFRTTWAGNRMYLHLNGSTFSKKEVIMLQDIEDIRNYKERVIESFIRAVNAF